MAAPRNSADRARRATVLAVFFLSGACALVYQVLWVRLLILRVGATSVAVALVLATFMAGLGLGSLIASRVTHRVRSPLAVYAVLEVAIGVAALAMPAAIGAVGSVAAGLLPAEASRTATMALLGPLCFLLLLVPTTCMGATLPILSKWIARDEATRGQDLGTLYSVNTLGAFLGTVFTGFVAIEAFGISTTNGAAALANFAVAGLALTLGRREAAMAVDPTEPRGERSRELWTVLLLGAAAGFLGLAHEVIWTRIMGLVLITTTYAFTTILATVIGGIGVGSLLGARAADRAEDPKRLFGLLQLGIGLGALLLFPMLLAVLRYAPQLLEAGTLPFASHQLIAVAVCAAVMAPPALLMGATFPALARAVTAGCQDVGRRVGQLYIWNTLAGVGGSLVAGFLLLPRVGALGSVQVLAAANLLLGAWVARPRRGARPSAVWVLLILVALGVAVGSAGRVSLRDLYQARLPEGSEILHLEEGVTSTVMVADHSDPPVRRIWIQSVWVAGTGGTHRMLGHLSMLHAPGLERAVGIAFGTGQSFASARLHGLERLDCVDLDEGMVMAGSHWFAEQNDHLLDQPGVHVYIDDGRAFLGHGEAQYDAVLMEPLQPWFAGAVNLYTREFYELAVARLRPGGTITQWMPIDDVPADMTRSVVATLAAVFPEVWVYLDNYDLWIVGRKSGEPVDLQAWRERLGQPAVSEDLIEIRYGDVESILATLVVGPADVTTYVGDAPLLTDDHPFMEFEAPRVAHESWFAPNVEALLEACRAPLAGFVEPAGRPLPDGLRSCELGSLLAQVNMAHDRGDLFGARDLAREAHLLAPKVGRPAGVYRNQTAFLAGELAKRGDPAGAIQAYQQHLSVDDGFLGVPLNLALLQARTGQPEQALATLEAFEGRPGALSDRITAMADELRARGVSTQLEETDSEPE